MEVVDGVTAAADEFGDNVAKPLGAKPDVKAVHVSKSELDFYRRKFEDVSSVRFCRIHCTSCDKHLGSAPAAHRLRFEHPLLRVLMCSQCFDFYTSGEFETDEDGSELYCRWCGQGGQVYCCAICPFVFCKKCIKRNLGMAMVNGIEQSDDWLCYGCRPDDIWLQRATNWALKKYSSQLMSINPQDLTAEQIVEISQDYSTCCKKDKPKKADVNALKIRARVTGLKRPSSASDDQSSKKLRVWFPMVVPKTVSEHKDTPPPPPSVAPAKDTNAVAPVVPAPADPPIMSGENSDEVVCTPDILPIGEEEEFDESTAQNSTKARQPAANAAAAAAAADSDDDCKIIDDPPQKKSYVQVKPVSKLLCALNQQNSQMPPPPPMPVVYPKNVLKITSKEPPPLVMAAGANADAMRPMQAQQVSVQQIQMQQMPVQLPVQPLPVSLQPTETVQKMIKIVSPDGRSFYIDPLKLIPPSSPPGPIVLQTLAPASTNPDVSVKKLDWFNRAITEWQYVIQALTTNIVELVHLHNGGVTNAEYLYTNFQIKIQSSIEKMEELKRRLANNFFYKNVPSFSKGVQSDDKDEPTTVDSATETQPPPLAIIGKGVSSSSNHPVSIVAAESLVSGVDCSIPTILDDLRRLVEIPPSDSPGMTITGDLTNDADVAAKCDDPAKGDNASRGVADPEDVARRPTQTGYIGYRKRIRKRDRDGCGRFSKNRTDSQKFKSSCKTTAERTDRSTDICQPGDQTDHIYDMRVTCDSDESDDCGGDDDNGNRDSDYVVDEDDGNDTDSVVSNKSSVRSVASVRSSVKSIVVINDEDVDSEIQEIVAGTANKSDGWNDVADIEEISDDEVDRNDKKAAGDVEERNDGARVDDEDEKNGGTGADDVKFENVDADGSVSDTPASENDDGSGEKTGRSNNSIVSDDDDENKSSSSRSASVRSRASIDRSNSSAPSRFEPTWTTRPVVDSEEDLAAIAEAIRESIRDVAVSTAAPRKTSANDLEELLTSNVVFKRPDCGSPDPLPKPHVDVRRRFEKTDISKSFGDAFSNFVATVSDAGDKSPAKGVVRVPGETDLENEMEQLQRLAEKCIAKSNEQDGFDTGVDC